MNKIEFNEVMKVFDLDDYSWRIVANSGMVEEHYNYKNLEIYYGGSYYTVVRGKIPLEVANRIYEKYPLNPYKIRVEGGCEDWNPLNWATDDIYEKYLKENNFTNSLRDKQQRIKLRRRSNKNKYIKSYHIDTKEGLLIFLIEINNYYARMNNLPELEEKVYNILIETITNNIINITNPTISAYDWMQGDNKNKEMYNKTIYANSKTKLGQLFQNALDNFDKAVNPFMNNDIELDSVGNYLNKVKINANSFNNYYGEERNNCCSLSIIEKDTCNNTIYRRLPSRFSFSLSYEIDDENFLNVMHYFDNTETNKGETIILWYWYFKNNTRVEKHIKFNLTNGTIYINGEKVPVTFEQIAFIYDELLNATKYASNVTIDNMKKQNNCKKLVHKTN